MPFFQAYVLLIPIISWIVVHVVKIVLRMIQGEKCTMELFRSGGMPSAHSAFIVSITCSFAVIYGIFHPFFTALLCLSSIIMYDAMNVRFQVGKHAEFLNTLRKDTTNPPFPISIGHTPEEVFVGACIGAFLGFVLPLLPIMV